MNKKTATEIIMIANSDEHLLKVKESLKIVLHFADKWNEERGHSRHLREASRFLSELLNPKSL